MSKHDTALLIKQRLQAALHPKHLTVIDESLSHAGHAGAAAGGGHFSVEVVSEAFVDKNLMERHRLIYQALGELMQHEIHALRIRAKSPIEAAL